jgi:hypothetical protein
MTQRINYIRQSPELFKKSLEDRYHRPACGLRYLECKPCFA